MPEHVIQTEHLLKQYETAAGISPVLKGINLTVARGEFLAIMGPSGSGKSTFMNILGCLDTATSGHYYVNGQDVTVLGRNQLAHLRNKFIGFVFQGYNLLPRLSARDNVSLPLVYSGASVSEMRTRAQEMLEKMGLGQFTDFLPNQMSGGQQQRVAIARALVNNPNLILADEPTGNLDTATSYEIMDVLTKLNESDSITIVLVTHEPDIASYAKRLVRFVDGQIVYDGAPPPRKAREGT